LKCNHFVRPAYESIRHELFGTDSAHNWVDTLKCKNQAAYNVAIILVKAFKLTENLLALQ